MTVLRQPMHSATLTPLPAFYNIGQAGKDLSERDKFEFGERAVPPRASQPIHPITDSLWSSAQAKRLKTKRQIPINRIAFDRFSDRLIIRHQPS